MFEEFLKDAPNDASYDAVRQSVVVLMGSLAKHLDKSDPEAEFETYIVWKCKALQNWKYLISTSLYDGMYYELTYNGDRKEWYLDAYKKFENRCIPALGV